MILDGGYPLCLDFSARRALVKETAGRYRSVAKKQKTAILDEFVTNTDLNRHYAARLLKNWGRRVPGRSPTGQSLVFEAIPPRRRKRPAKYAAIIGHLEWLYRVADYICSRRLYVFIHDNLPGIMRRGERKLSKKELTLLMGISASSIDRHLKSLRRKNKLKSGSHTKPGTLLKNQIPIRHHGEWPKLPGYLEADLVSHDGGDAGGQFNHTLNLTDIQTTWTHLVALLNKAHHWVIEGLDQARAKLPFPVLGFDSDNGGEFINHAMIKYCGTAIEFTRSRSNRKNDNCYVEQKNSSVVRKIVGYDRLDSEDSFQGLKRLYGIVNQYTNHFQPTRKLIEKIRVGNRTQKRYDNPQTPYRRVLTCPEVDPEVKEKLRQEHEFLSPVRLHLEMERLQGMLIKLARKRGKDVFNRIQHVSTSYESPPAPPS